MKRFNYFEPKTMDEAVQLLQQHNGQAMILAGGTDLLVEIKGKLHEPDHVVNIKRIPDLDHFDYEPGRGLRFGALVTARQIETWPVVQEKYAGLAQAVRELASIQVRNRATVVGNICRASPSADTLPPLIADGAHIRTFGPSGERTYLLEQFFTGPGKTVLEPAELATEVLVPDPPPHTGKVYIKHGRRKAMELATVGVALTLTVEDGRSDGRITDPRIVLGAVAPTPIRAPQAEALLEGNVLSDSLVEEVALTAMNESRPISDVRSSASYRREMVRVLTARAVRQAWERATR
jgi:carbon-monoxide dehydrogenase medium subunit